MQARHGFFLTAPLCSGSLPSSGGLPAGGNGKPSNPGCMEGCDPFGAVGAAMFTILKVDAAVNQ